MGYSIIGIIIVLAFVITSGELFRTQSYKVTDKNIIIHRKIGNINIAINQIVDIKEFNSLTNIKMVRLCGFNAGPLASIRPFGLFYSLKYGIMHLYITKSKKYFLIILKNKKKYLISPEDNEIILIDKYFIKN